jgi:cytosine/adenosine deaminase-related metal-dependent hydrolase
MIGAHASFTLEDETLGKLSALARELDRGVHVHVAEDNVDEVDSLRRSGMRAARRLDEAGILRPSSVVAHGVHLDEAELETVQRRRSWLVHNCRSNLNNSLGRAPVARFGSRAALGTDGIDQDMFAESRTAFFRAREDSLEASAERLLEMLAAGAELVSEHFETPIGVIQPGYSADIVVLRYDPPTPLTAENLAWHWMFALTGANVESVMVNGEWTLRNGEFCQVDEEKVRAEAAAEARKLWERMSAL